MTLYMLISSVVTVFSVDCGLVPKLHFHTNILEWPTATVVTSFLFNIVQIWSRALSWVMNNVSYVTFSRCLLPPLMDVFSDHAPLVQSGRSRTRRNVNDISERAGSHYLRSTRQSIVGLDAGFTWDDFTSGQCLATLILLQAGNTQTHQQQPTCLDNKQLLPLGPAANMLEGFFKCSLNDSSTWVKVQHTHFNFNLNTFSHIYLSLMF